MTALIPPVTVLQPSRRDCAERIEAFFSLRGDGHTRRSFHEYDADANFNLILRLSTSGCRAVLLGPATVRAVVERDQRAEYLGLRFRLGQTPALIDATATELTDTHAELTTIGPLRLDDLVELLFHQRDPVARQRILEGLILPIPHMARSARAIPLARLIEIETGTPRVADVANRLGISVRSLERLCLAELGLSPKRLQRVVRLRKALRLLRDNGHTTLARLAHACGYVDQSHLVKDFKELTGRPPGSRRAFEPRQIQGVPEARIVHRYRDCGPGYRTIGVSRPGYLGTPLGSGRTAEEQADLFAATLDTLKLDRAAILAVSGGGPSAIEFALRHSSRCAALLLISTCSGPMTERIPLAFNVMKAVLRHSWIARLLERRASGNIDRSAARSIPDPYLRARTLAHPEAGPLFRELLLSTSNHMAQRIVGTDNDIAITRTKTYTLERIASPCLIVHGTADTVVSFRHASSAASRIPGAVILPIENGQHVSIFTHRDEIRAAVTAFLFEHLGAP